MLLATHGETPLHDDQPMTLSDRISRLSGDARHGQIAAQATLLAILTHLDFGPDASLTAIFIGTTLAMETLLAHFTRRPVNWKSALSTGLSLSLLLRTHDPLAGVAAGVLAIGSKALFRINGKHLFNPSAFAIVGLLALTPHVWVSPGQWGTRPWLAALAGSMALLILFRVRRFDISLAFLLSHATLLFGRALWLGDPMAIPLHQMRSGSLLIFALFMLTDPRSTPDGSLGRILFAIATAAIAHGLIFFGQIPEGLLFALILVSCATPFIDRFLPGRRFAWTHVTGATPSCAPSLAFSA
jgi:Na+-translocating ferredoxin:NAD+ oxidoreductase RnfD subunit